MSRLPAGTARVAMLPPADAAARRASAAVASAPTYPPLRAAGTAVPGTAGPARARSGGLPRPAGRYCPGSGC